MVHRKRKQCGDRKRKNVCEQINDKRSFRFTRNWYTIWLVNCDRLCQHSSITEADEICEMPVIRDLSTGNAMFKFVFNNLHTKRFSPSEVPSQKTEGLHKNVVNGNVFAILPYVHHLQIMVVCPALMAIMKDQLEHLIKFRVAVMAIGSDEEAIKNRKVQDCVYMCKYCL